MGANLTYHEHLGSGASGEVYRVTWKSKQLGKIEAAAKKIKLQGEPAAQQKREIEFLKRLDHKNIVKYYDTILEKKHVAIVTEFAAKGSLYDYLEDKDKLPKHLLHRWILHLARGVDYLKKEDVAHRDLKSPNCIITADDVLKICDFGIAKDLTSTKTTESTKGSVRWQAPELLKDLQLSPKADIFAFGIIVWEMVSCERPYEGKRNEYVIYHVMVNSLRPMIPDDCPQFLKELIERCWHQDHTQRPESTEIVESVYNEYFNEAAEFQWRVKHDIGLWGPMCFVASDHLAICGYMKVEVHHVSREETHLLYTLTSNEWRWGGWALCDAAVSESMPDSILVVCSNIPYVYQFPCHEASTYVKKYQIHDGNVDPQCIEANANTAVIGLCDMSALVVCNLPGFTQQRVIYLGYTPYDMSISGDYLLVMGGYRTVIKTLSDLDQDLCRIQPPHGVLQAVSFRYDAHQLYAASYHNEDNKWHVYKYIWDGNGTPSYHNAGCVIEDVGNVMARGLSLTSNGLLAVCSLPLLHTKIFNLE